MDKVEISLNVAYRLIGGGAMALVTARYKGRDNLMAASWVVPVSHTPSLVAVSIHPKRYTHDLVKKSGAFILNIPGRAILEQANRCGEISGSKFDDKFAAVGLTRGAGRKVDAPWVEECLAHMECSVVDASTQGDHTLFIGEVLGAWAVENSFSDTWTLADEEVKPLYHLGRNVYTIPTELLIVTPKAK